MIVSIAFFLAQTLLHRATCQNPVTFETTTYAFATYLQTCDDLCQTKFSASCDYSEYTQLSAEKRQELMELTSGLDCNQFAGCEKVSRYAQVLKTNKLGAVTSKWKGSRMCCGMDHDVDYTPSCTFVHKFDPYAYNNFCPCRGGPAVNTPEVCLIYNDPVIKPFGNIVHSIILLEPDFHTLMDTAGCSGGDNSAVYVLIGWPQSAAHGYSPVAAIFELGARTIWLTTSREVFDSTGPPPQLPATITIGSTVIEIKEHSVPFYGLSGGIHGIRLTTNHGVDLRVYEFGTAGVNYGRVQLNAPSNLAVGCSTGVCSSGNAGRKKRAVFSTLSAEKRAGLKDLVVRFQISPMATNPGRRPMVRKPQQQREAEAQNLLGVTLEPGGPFAACHKLQGWDAESNYKVAWETAAMQDVSRSDLKFAAALAKLNCDAVGSEPVPVDLAIAEKTWFKATSTIPEPCRSCRRRGGPS